MFCTKCGKEVSDDANFCPNCGVRTRKGVEELKDGLSKVGEEISKGLSIAAKEIEKAFKIARDSIRESTIREVVICPNCGEKNLDDANFCNKCGKKFN